METKKTKSALINETVIARIERAGVFMGILTHIDSDIVRLTNVRRIYYWEGALSVTDMASNGIKSGKVSKPCELVEFNRTALVEINKCSDKAAECITAIKPWSC